jgi:hypothetical protein
VLSSPAVLRWAILVCLVACSSPPRKPKPTRDWLSRVVATGDREHPQRITLNERGRGIARARSDGPGTWWYTAEIPDREPNPEIQEWWTKVDVDVRSPSKRISLQVSDDNDHLQAGIPGEYGGATVSIPETRTPPRSLLIGITTTRATTFTVDTLISRRGIAKPPPTPCDPLHIDHTNPACEGVDPPCNLVSPDITNRNCCFATSCNLVSGCFARVTARVSKNTLRVSIGTRDGIMTMAQGLVTQRNKRVSTGHVQSVEDDALTFRVDEPQKLDESILLSEQTQVRLMQPEWCRPARPIHNVDAAPSP